MKWNVLVKIMISTRYLHRAVPSVYIRRCCSDMVGPRDPVSNLREMKFHKKPNETPLERVYRERRQETYMWNQTFWRRHNENFVKERKEFIQENTNEDKLSLNADEMSVFYKQFLDKNWKTHLAYNLEWYKRNIALLALSIRVCLEGIRLRIKL